ncbi:MAG: Arm DNA-binding domain-containing protein [Brevundimonas sp.]|uniref:Arm DNA-binding domain-containing protein n=1 Tax=Brevundimonas sp. TaxID=1871086 RepID=UPI00391C348F
MPGMYADGGGLYLQVSRSGSKSWIFRYAMEGREREMGLGPLHTVSLSEARELALEARKLKLRGIDPIDARNAAQVGLEEVLDSFTSRSCALSLKPGLRRRRRCAWTEGASAY